ncbi:hypothetical protein [Streptomyces hyaluromycini]|uniref:hypothetical protein n=1 Tax=Streptomyces hyaluromycini TaxID=1377993 RepID=UPI003D9F2EC3
MNRTSSAPPVRCGIEPAKSFGSARALDGVDIAVRAGEPPAVMGAAGSGRSTLPHCLADIALPDGGNAPSPIADGGTNA